MFSRLRHDVARTLLVAAILATGLAIVGAPKFVTVERAEATTDVVELRPNGGGRQLVRETPAQPFELVGLQLDSVPDEPLQLRTRTDGRWSEWTHVRFDDDHGPDPGSDEAAGAAERPSAHSEPIWVGDADAYEIDAPAAVSTASVVLVRQTTETVEVRTRPVEAGADADRPTINDRSTWNARAPAGGFGTASSMTRAIVHHTVGSNSYAAGDVPGILRSIQAYHIDGNGWSDIGYNFLVDRFGRVWEGRDRSIESLAIGAHAAGYNTGSVGVASMGNHETAAPTAAQVQGISSIIAWKMSAHDASPGTPIVGHRDVGSTACPGAMLYSQLSTIRTQVAAARSGDARPVGAYSTATPGPRTVRLTGWAADPDTPNPIQLHAYVNGRVRGMGFATLPRGDMGAIADSVGTDHGFDVTLDDIPAGRNEICVYAINATPNMPNPLLGCRDVTIGGPPRATFTGLRYAGGGRLSATGWAFDPDTTNATVRFAVDGRVVPDVRTSVHSAGIPGAYSTFGTRHGYDVRLPIGAAGAHTVCGFVLDTAGSTHRFIGCRSISVPRGEPYGAIDTATGGPDGRLTIRGWAHDPDTAGTSTIRVTVDGRQRYLGPTNTLRPDVDRFFPTAGPRHGFAIATGGLRPGRHEVCVTAVNRYLGARDTSLGCRTVAIDGGSPFGSLDAVTSESPGTARVRGWVIDPDVSRPAVVHVYDMQPNRGYDIGPADGPRTDVAAVFPRWGTDHGFDATVRGLSSGPHLLCAYGIDVGLGANTRLGCAWVQVR